MSGADRSVLGLARILLNLSVFRFLIVGILNTAVGYIIFLAGIGLSLSPAMALAIATVIGAVFNYFSTGHLVFRNAGLSKLPLFLGAYLVIYLGNLAALNGLITLGMPAPWAQVILLPVVAGSSFVIFKFLVFRVRNQ